MRHTAKLLFTLSLTLAGLILTSTAMAAGTAANTTISNQATLNYKVGGVDQTAVNSNQVDFKVDAKIDMTMNTPTASVAPGSSTQALLFTLQNTGNQTQGFRLELFTGVDATDDDFDMTGVTLYWDNDDNGVYDGTEPVYTIGNNLKDLAANETIKILLVGSTPGTATDAQTAKYTLKATALDAGTTTDVTETAGADTANAVDTVFGDGDAGAGVGASSDGAENAKYLGTGTFTVSTATVAVVKGAVIVSDPFSAANPKAIPGAIIEYTIDITNSGAADATTVVLSDPIPANTWFVVGSQTVSAGGAVTWSSDNGATYLATPTDGGDLTDHGITHIKGAFATVTGSGGTAQLKFRVMIQ